MEESKIPERAESSSNHAGRQFYVSILGDDHQSGLSPDEAWRTTLRVNQQALKSGDCISFQGGQTFPGTLVMENVDSDNEPVTVTSYGPGRAEIDGGGGSGIIIQGCSGIVLQNIHVRGDGRTDGNQQGVGVHIIDCHHVQVDHVDTSGFQRAGVEVEGSSHVRLTYIYAHDNGFAGITTSGKTNRDVYVGYCRANNNPGDPTIRDNHSGNGICLYSVQGALVEFCEAAHNGWDMQQENWNGPVGIWTACGADRVVIQYCIAHDNKSPKGDGGGFDFDGGTTNCVLQYNYSYNNDGCGYLLCQYPGGDLWQNNIVRYCISENDGRHDHKAGILTGAGDGKFSGCEVYNNVVYNEDGRNCVHGGPPDSRFRNNVFIIKGSGSQITETQGALFQGNAYWTIDGDIRVEGNTSLEEWRQATGQETLDGQPTGIVIDPRMTLPDKRPHLVNPIQITRLPFFRLEPDSPLQNLGLNLKAVFGMDTPVIDFFGNALPEGGTNHLGAHVG